MEENSDAEVKVNIFTSCLFTTGPKFEFRVRAYEAGNSQPPSCILIFFSFFLMPIISTALGMIGSSLLVQAKKQGDIKHHK